MEDETREAGDIRGAGLLRTPVKAKQMINTRSRTKLDAEMREIRREIELDKADDNIPANKDTEAATSSSIDGASAITREESRLTNDKIEKMFERLLERLEKLEEREKRFDNADRTIGCQDTNARDKTSNAIRESARPTVVIGSEKLINAKLPKGGWLKNPFDDLKYIGRADKQNPCKFIEKFEEIANYENVGSAEQLYYFSKCMRETALNWFDVREPKTIGNAKEAFLEHFWGDEQQSRFREEIYAGTYNRESRMTMSEYALNISKQAKYLKPPMSEQEIIRCVKRHFGTNVAREIRPSTVRNIEDLIKLLDEIEYERERARKLIRNTAETRINRTFVDRKRTGVEYSKNDYTTSYAQRGADVATSRRAVSYYKRDNGNSGAKETKSAEQRRNTSYDYRGNNNARLNKPSILPKTHLERERPEGPRGGRG